MITIRIGEKFCSLYNENNGTSLTPKQIFTDVIAPIWFNLDENSGNPFKKYRHILKVPKNSPFDACFKVKKEEEPYWNYQKAFDRFCDILEDNDIDYGLMDSRRVYGGCAMAQKNGKFDMNTSFFTMNDNLDFTIDERYCSFIGCLFGVKIKKFQVYVNNYQFIWDLWEAINEYAELLKSNQTYKGGCVLEWNGNYLVRKYIYEEDQIDPYCIVNKTNGEVKGIEMSMFSLILATLNETPKYIELKDYTDKCTKSIGAILVDVESIKNIGDFYRQFGIGKAEIKFDWSKLSKENVTDSTIFKEILRNGSMNSRINTIYMRGIINKSNYTKLEFIMKKESVEIAKELGDLIEKCRHCTNKSVIKHKEDIFNAYNYLQLMNAIRSFCKITDTNLGEFQNVSNYIATECDTDKNELGNILRYAECYYESLKK